MAKSPRVVPGQPYQFNLFAHCGLDRATDFDGSFWHLSNPSAVRPGLYDDIQEGTMTLMDAHLARFVSEHGVILFIRDAAVKRVKGCD